MLCGSDVATMEVKLILAVGSRAGLEAPLLPGYYMIGRDGECQIRPKSRSVSRQHCLLLNEGGQMRVFDLQSTAGTRINERRLVPHQWYPLADGDSLRCGKILFNVEMPAPVEDDVPDRLDDEVAESFAVVDLDSGDLVDAITDAADDSDDSDDLIDAFDAGEACDGRSESKPGSMLTGAPWQESDIAEFLRGQDDADREVRYAAIRDHHAAKTEASESADFDALDADLRAASRVDTQRRRAVASGEPAEALTRKGTLPRQRFNFSRSLPRFAIGSNPKIILAAVLVIVACGLAVRGVYQFWAGTEVRIVEGIE